MRYTEKQRQAIDTQSGSVLVSAAAGSGKTSVLARRIAELVKGGADITRMLVMTFTNAAAAEMRRRISAALYEDAVSRGDKRMLTQSELVGAADISTFHSFCAKVVRENYHIIETAPNFRIMGEGESATVRNGVLREYFDILYEKQDVGFLRLLSRFTTRANDGQLAARLLKVYDRMMGQPRPFEWALRAAELPEDAYTEALAASYRAMAAKKLEDAYATMRAAAEIAEAYCEKQPAEDAPVLEQLRAFMMWAREDIRKACAKFSGFSIPPIKRGAAPEVAARTGDMRREARKAVKEVLEDGLLQDTEASVRGQLRHTRADVLALVGLARMFDRMYTVKKRELNALDYEDLQRKTLQVMEQCGTQYSSQFDYIFVDEYQDTNPLQEEIVKAVHSGGNKLFMVGDVKQSIYKFRLADPGIFRRKAALFRDGGHSGEIIMMNENFRSAGNVIDAVNFVMESIMSEELGEIDYSGGERLIAMSGGGTAEILLCETGQDEPEDEGGQPVPAHTAQAGMIAQSIEGVLGEPPANGGKAVSFGDVAILLRSRSGLARAVKEALDARGVPCVISMKDASDTVEIELFMNLLKLISNPLQDIPLLSVMRSFIGNFDEREFVRIRLCQNDQSPFYGAVYRYVGENDDGLSRKLKRFLRMVEDAADTCGASALGRFIPALAERFDFYSYLMSRKNGNARKEMFDELIAQMLELVESCGNSLYRLLAAMEDNRKRDGSYLRAADSAARADCVRIMTIHGSKGLEFPVVYIADMNKRFNTRDMHEPFLMHGEMGVSAAYVDEEKREKLETVEQMVFKDKLAKENRSEELRMLYVAMTRAKERLFLTGHVKSMEKQEEKWRNLAGRYDKAGCMLDWIMAANHGKNKLRVNVQAFSAKDEEQEAFDLDSYMASLRQAVPAELIRVEKKQAVPAKVSVSAVKREHSAHAGVRSFLTASVEDGEITGAHLGTLVHSVMERVIREGEFDAVATELLQKELITPEEHEALLKNREMVEGFLAGGLYKRMKGSERLILEQPFNMRVGAQDIGYGTDESMLVQGILDAAFMENGQWVLVDYKTDRVSGETVKQAAEGYRVQLELYARALEQITKIPVREMYLYFLRLGRDYLL